MAAIKTINFNDVYNFFFGQDEVYHFYIDNQLVWEKVPQHDYSLDYLTFTALESGTFSFSINNVQYSLDNGSTWTTLTAGSSTPTVNAGNKILWKQTGLTPATNIGIGTFSSTGSFDVTGNVMSLYYGDNFSNQKSLSGKNYAFCALFKNCTTVHNAKDLVLPATTLFGYCYYQMFNGATNLITAPELPATTLTTNCYRNMFTGCTSLTSAPTLPATTLVSGCYNAMFYGCTSLTSAPTLPATTLAGNCYYQMFTGCTSLTSAPTLPATTLELNCYRNMFTGCTSLNYIKCLATDISASYCTKDWVQNVAPTGTFVKAPSMASWTIGNNGIPTGWVTQDYHDYPNEYLTFTALESGTFSFSQNDLQYSTDNGSTWQTLTHDTSTGTISAGSKVLWKGSNLTADSSYGIGTFSSSGTFNVAGNIMSLHYGDNFRGQTDLTGKNYAFRVLFFECSTIVNAENLILPATTLSISCYRLMFEGCSSLITVPNLPATTLAINCYQYMFNGCISLTTVPNNLLPATTLTDYCYNEMFYGCTSLVTAPELPATTLAINCYSHMFDGTNISQAPALPAMNLADSCYYAMFQGCTSLTTAPVLPATIMQDHCYEYMFSGCTSLTTAPVLPATSLAYRCYRNLFRDCTSLTTAPALPATTLAEACYDQIFHGCTSLTTAPALPATTLAPECYMTMFLNCSSLTTAPDLLATQLVSDCYRRMFSGCTSLNYIKCLATDISATDCTRAWVENVAATGTFVKDASMNSWTIGNNGIPTGWVVEDESGGHDYSNDYLTFEAIDSGTFKFSQNDIQYSTNNGSTWSTLVHDTPTGVIAAGSKILWKSSTLTPDSTYGIGTFSSSGKFNVEGNIMSLYFGDNFRGQTRITKHDSYFRKLFSDCAKLINANNLILPIVSVPTYLYAYMFKNCTALQTAPAELPATALSFRCYIGMFQYCESLIKAPIIHASTFRTQCCAYMFFGCQSLNYIKCLATDISADQCTYRWVEGVASSGTFVKNTSMRNWGTGVSSIPSNWQVQNAT